MIAHISARYTKLRALLICLAAALYILLCLGHWRVQADDAYIFYTYVSNLLAGDGFVFNPGERVNGTTSILYPFVIASLSFLFSLFGAISIPLIAHLFLALCLAIAIGASFLILRAGPTFIAAVSFPIIFMASPHLSEASGMETFLTLSLLCCAYWYYLKDKLTFSAFLLGLSVLSRPDSVLFAAIIFADFIRKERRLPAAAVFVGFLIPVLIWLSWSTWYFGSPLPLSLSAKLALTEANRSGLKFPFLERLPEATWYFSQHTGLLEGFLILVLGAFVWIKSPQHPIRLILVWGIVYLLAYGLVLNTPGFRWYYIPLIFVQACILARFLELLLISFPKRITFLLVGICLTFLIYRSGNSSIARLQGQVTKKYAHYRGVAELLNSEATSGSSLASAEIGVLGFYYERGPIIDALGLITPGVSEHVKNRDYGQYIIERKPTYVLCAHPPRRHFEAFSKADWFQELYDPPRIIDIAGRKSALYQRRHD